MPKKVILSIDQGTTNSKAILVDVNGEIISKGSSSVNIFHPKPGWVEQDPKQIWDSVLKAIAQCLDQVSNIEILAIGISNQRESVTAWNKKTGEPLSPCLTWQCSRTSSVTEKIISDGFEPLVSNKTGLPISPLFPATKISWLLDEISAKDPSLPFADICIGTIDSWLIWNLTGGEIHACDRSNASRTQLYNIQTCEWDAELCKLFNVDINTLPEVKNSQDDFGKTSGLPILSDGIQIASAIGDSHAALFGHRAFELSDGKITFGTGSSIMTTIPSFIEPQMGLTTTIAWSIKDKVTYAIEGNILVAASAFPWAVEVLGFNDIAELIEVAESVEDSKGVSFVPAFVGLGAPHWKPNAKGIFSGLSFNSKQAHLARAVVESLALQVNDVFASLINQYPNGLGNIYIDGGPSENNFLMSLVAGFIDHPLISHDNSESSAIGAAYLAGLEINLWKDLKDISNIPKNSKVTTSHMNKRYRNNSIADWKKAVNLSTI